MKVRELRDMAAIAVRGADAADFLQGQLTCDVHALPSGRSCLAGVAAANGRVQALARLLALTDGWLLWLPQSQEGYLRQRLARYVLRARVTLDDESASWVALGVRGAEAGAALTRQVGTVPAPGRLVERDGLVVLALDSTPRFVALGPPEGLAALGLPVDVADGAWPPWILDDIRAGLPAILPPTRELFLPQMLNLDLLGGVSFRKGCYTGQEIITRTQHLGRITRRMARAHAAVPQAPQPGVALHAHNEVAGQVLYGCADGNGGSEFLAVVTLAHLRAPLRLASPEGAAVTLLPLPYVVPEFAGQ